MATHQLRLRSSILQSNLRVSTENIYLPINIKGLMTPVTENDQGVAQMLVSKINSTKDTVNNTLVPAMGRSVNDKENADGQEKKEASSKRVSWVESLGFSYDEKKDHSKAKLLLDVDAVDL